MDDAHADETPETQPSTRRPFRELALELWHQKPGAREPREPRAPITVKEIVNGLDRREILIGSFLTALAVVLAVLGYFTENSASTAAVRNGATDFLITMLIGAFLMGLGLFLRRRALLGFSSFLFGLEQATFQFIPGALIYLAFGGWLIWRVMQKGKADRAAGRDTRTIDTGRSRSSGAPRASKRYTPPKAGQRRR